MKTKKSRERQHKPVKQRNTHQTKSDKSKIQNKTEKKLDKNTSKHNKSQTQSKSFDSVGRTVVRGSGRASSSYHSSLILLYIVIPFKLAESRRV
jgi:hypothetical protein